MRASLLSFLGHAARPLPLLSPARHRHGCRMPVLRCQPQTPPGSSVAPADRDPGVRGSRGGNRHGPDSVRLLRTAPRVPRASPSRAHPGADRHRATTGLTRLCAAASIGTRQIILKPSCIRVRPGLGNASGSPAARCCLPCAPMRNGIRSANRAALRRRVPRRQFTVGPPGSKDRYATDGHGLLDPDGSDRLAAGWQAGSFGWKGTRFSQERPAFEKGNRQVVGHAIASCKGSEWTDNDTGGVKNTISPAGHSLQRKGMDRQRHSPRPVRDSTHPASRLEQLAACDRSTGCIPAGPCLSRRRQREWAMTRGKLHRQPAGCRGIPTSLARAWRRMACPHCSPPYPRSRRTGATCARRAPVCRT